MAPALPTHTRPGSARLHVDLVGGRSTVTSAFAASPTRLLTPISSGVAVWSYLATYGGGFVAGDHQHLNLRLGPGTRCFLSTQASSKIYRNHTTLPSRAALQASVGSGAVLAWVPDFVQPFARASYAQHQEVRLAADAGLVLLDGLSSGRSHCGERWAFRDYLSRTEILVNDQCLLLDVVRLDPNEGALDGEFRLGRFNALALLVLLGPPLQGAAEELLSTVAAQPIPRKGNLLLAASPISGGALLRIAAVEPQDAHRELRRFLGFLGSFLGDDPWSRKW